jgi:hypothetical protein
MNVIAPRSPCEIIYLRAATPSYTFAQHSCSTPQTLYYKQYCDICQVPSYRIIKKLLLSLKSPVRIVCFFTIVSCPWKFIHSVGHRCSANLVHYDMLSPEVWTTGPWLSWVAQWIRSIVCHIWGPGFDSSCDREGDSLRLHRFFSGGCDFLLDCGTNCSTIEQIMSFV